MNDDRLNAPTRETFLGMAKTRRMGTYVCEGCKRTIETSRPSRPPRMCRECNLPRAHARLAAIMDRLGQTFSRSIEKRLRAQLHNERPDMTPFEACERMQEFLDATGPAFLDARR